MKQLQNNFTTSEQSKRLLELGLPANSADMFIDGRSKLQFRNHPYENDDFFLTHVECTPCWSVGRLIELFEICTGKTWENEIIPSYSKIEMLMEDFEDRENKYVMNYQTLKDYLISH